MIRILHTSDWHLGLELGGHDRLEEQRLFLDWLRAECANRKVDALLVCGDVYDVVNPSIAAQSLFAEFLVEFRLALPDATVVVVAGNHDSGARLELPRPFGDALGRIHLRGLVSESVDAHLVPLRGRDGAVGAWCVALPFLRSGDLDCRLEGDETPQQAHVRAVGNLYRKTRERIPEDGRNLPVVAIGHLTLAGSRRAGSERILIGGVESVPVGALAEGCAYVALGHIHRAQTVGAENVRYSGSPYPVDFDEFRYRHKVLVVELDRDGTAVEQVDVPEFVPFLRFCDPPRPWSEVESAVEAFDWSPWSGVRRELRPLVELRYDATQPVADLRNRCEALCKDKPFRLVSAPKAISRTPETEDAEVADSKGVRERETPEALLARHWKAEFGSDVPDAVMGRFREAVDEVVMEGSVG